jgi:hypothetical protein
MTLTALGIIIMALSISAVVLFAVLVVLARGFDKI